MKILIQVGYDFLGIEAGGQVGAILAALENAKIYQGDYGKKPYTPKGTAERPEPIKVEIVQDECFVESTPMIDDLTKNLKDAEARWLDYYSRYNAAQKELSELKAKLEQINPNKEETGNEFPE